MNHIIGACGAVILVVVILIGASILSPPRGGNEVRQAALSPTQDREMRLLRDLGEKIGECYDRGGVAKLDRFSVYLGCDLPVKP